MRNIRIRFISIFVFSLLVAFSLSSQSLAQGTISILKQTIPVNNNQNFDFTSDIPGFAVFSITSNNGFLEGPFPNGVYTVTEAITPGFSLGSINCNTQNVTINVDNRTVIIDLMNEDVICSFVNAANGTITITKSTNPAGALNFSFSENITEPNGSFMLDDAQDEVFLDVPPGQYTVTEDDPTVMPGGFFLSDIVCDDMGSNTDIETRTAFIDLDSEEDITCTFTNTAQLEGLIMTKSDSPDPVAVGQELRYEISIMNNSNIVATDVLLVDDLPDGLIGVEIVSNISGVDCIFDTPFNPNNATCEIPDLAPGQDLGITIVVRPDPNVFLDPTIIINTATLTAQPGNVMRTATAETLVNPIVDVEIDAGNQNKRVNRGNRFPITYDISVNPDNQGVLASLNSEDAQIRVDATDVMFDVEFPGVFGVDSVETTQGSCIIGFDSVIECDLGDIQEGETVRVTIIFIAPNERGDFTIQAIVNTLAQTFDNFVFIFVRNDGSDCSLAAAGSMGTSNLLYLFIPLFIFARRYWSTRKTRT